ncbi:MAG TPA: mechanosensitive ion channel family protein [candidate division Zixibacteria bacterium]|nr:mechanosensitive ion channel family protein [candidate division Zixibacteria bacterium]
MVEIFRNWLIDIGVSESPALYLGWVGIALAILILAYAANYIAKRFLLAGVSYFVKKTKTKWDDVLLKRKVFTRLSHFAPALIIYGTAYLFETAQGFIERLAMIYMIFAGILVINAFLNAVVDIYRTFEISKQRPIKGYVQIAQIIIFVSLGIIVISTLMNRSPWLLLSGLGAMTAVILLIFKDSILGLVASVQLSGNDMVRLGDWIEMPQYGADGDVIDITLTTVKVQNWDKTITTIPAYSLISDSFKNWRGMSESGGRRIKRAVYIDMNSIKFCTPDMLARFEKYQLLTDYIRTRKDEIAKYNKEHNIDTSELINGRNMTNVGTFRAYIIAYLRNHPKIHQNMTFLIRHLPPSEKGLPIEIYVFSNDQEWANYEAIQADIFDHILSVVPMFDLRVFQNPTGNDFREISKVN